MLTARQRRILDAAKDALDRGIDGTSQRMVDAIRAQVPDLVEGEIAEALEANLES
jgi:hypothetical protein